MRIPWTPLIIFILLSVFSDAYIYRALRNRLKNKFWCRLQKWSAVVFYALLVCAIALPRKAGDNEMLLTVMWMLYTFLSVYIAKYIYVIIDMIACIPCVVRRKRIKTISVIALVVSVFTFAVMWWGALVDRFMIDVREIGRAHV